MLWIAISLRFREGDAFEVADAEETCGRLVGDRDQRMELCKMWHSTRQAVALVVSADD